MGSRGSQNPNWQRYIPKPVVLAQVIGANNPAKISHFQVPFPDSRLRVKTSFLFVRTDLSDSTQPIATLWLAESDIEDGGMRGDDIPLNDVEGSFAARTAIPEAVGLLGYSREFVSAADYIQGELTVSPGALGYWLLQTRYQPQAVSFSAEEWGLITAQCNPTGNQVRVG